MKMHKHHSRTFTVTLKLQIQADDGVDLTDQEAAIVTAKVLRRLARMSPEKWSQEIGKVKVTA